MHAANCNCYSCLIRAGYKPEQILTCSPCKCKATGVYQKECGLSDPAGLGDLASLPGLVGGNVAAKFQNNRGGTPTS